MMARSIGLWWPQRAQQHPFAQLGASPRVPIASLNQPQIARPVPMMSCLQQSRFLLQACVSARNLERKAWRCASGWVENVVTSITNRGRHSFGSSGSEGWPGMFRTACGPPAARRGGRHVRRKALPHCRDCSSCGHSPGRLTLRRNMRPSAPDLRDKASFSRRMEKPCMSGGSCPAISPDSVGSTGFCGLRDTQGTGQSCDTLLASPQKTTRTPMPELT